MDIGYLAAVSAALTVFFIASVQDLREREVDDILWIALGAVAFLLMAAEFLGGAFQLPWTAFVVFLLPLFLFADMFVDWNGSFGKLGSLVRYGAGCLLLILSLLSVLSYIGETYVDIFLSIPLWILFIFLLYKLDVVKGGADAKALVSLSVLFPLYPPAVDGVVQPLFSSLTLPFFLSVLLMGAVFSLAVPLWLLFFNIAQGHVKVPHMLLGRVKEVGAVDLRKEWLLEIPDGNGNHQRVRKLGEIDEPGALESIRSLGWTSVWTSPKIPFILPLTAGLLFVLVFGNPVLYI